MTDHNDSSESDALTAYAEIIRVATESVGDAKASLLFGSSAIDACIRDLAREVAMLRADHALSQTDPRLASREYWVDDRGNMHRVLKATGRLKFRTDGPASLRAFVFRRDGFQCVACGIAADAPDGYTGRDALVVRGGGQCLVADHIVSSGLGRTHHPDNLQTLCDSCNARKGSMSNERFRERLARRVARDAKFAARMEALNGVR